MSLISFTALQDGVTSVNAAATNNPLNTIYNDYNGNITDANIASNAAIAGTKIAPGAIRTAIGVIAGATLGSTGNKAVTGVGFQPKLVRFTVIPTADSARGVSAVGAMTASSQFTVATATNNSNVAARNSSTSACIGWVNGGSSTFVLLASRVSLDADGFTINVGTAAATFDVAWETYG